MKKIICILLGICMGVVCFGESPAVGKNLISFGNHSVYFYKNGIVLVAGKGIRSLTSLNIGTAAGYYSFGSKKADSTFTSPEKGVFMFKASVPEDKNDVKMNVSQEVGLNPMGALEFQMSWNPAVPDNAKDIFYSLRFPMTHFKDQKVLVSNREVMISNRTEYGFFSSILVNPKLVFYNWDAEKRFTVQCEEKVKIVMQSSKDKEYILRIYPVAGSKSLRFTLIFK